MGCIVITLILFITFVTAAVLGAPYAFLIFIITLVLASLIQSLTKGENIKLYCRNCKADLIIDDETPGKQWSCPKCKKSFFYSPSTQSRYDEEVNKHKMFIYYFVMMLHKLACVDGPIDDNENKTINFLLNDVFKLEHEPLNYAIDILNKADSNPKSFEDLAVEFHRIFNNQKDVIHGVIKCLIELAFSDYEINNKEKGLILNAIKIFNMNEDTYNNILYQYFDEILFKDTRIFISAMAKFAKADGVITKDELNIINEIMQAMGLKNELLKYCQNIFTQAKNLDKSFRSLIFEFYDINKTVPDRLNSAIDTLFYIALANKQLYKIHEDLIKEAASIFRISDNIYNTIKSKYVNVSTKGKKDHYELLECDLNATIEEIKKNYRKLSKEYHPDKHMGKGASEEEIKKATAKFKEIQNAYEKIKKERAFN